MDHLSSEAHAWHDILSSVTELLGAREVVLSTMDVARAHFVLGPIACDPASPLLNAWTSFAGRVPWLSNHRYFARNGVVVRTDDVMARNQLVQSAFYKSYLEPRDLAFGLIMVIKQGAGKITWLHVLRSGSDTAFGTKEASLLKGLQPMLTRMLQIVCGIGSLQQLHNSLAGTLEHLSTGVALITDDDAICNRQAKDILAENDGLQLVDGRLTAKTDENAALQAMINGGQPGDMSIRRPSGRRALEISVRKLGRGQPAEADGCQRVAVYILDPERRSPASTTYLRQAFGLTRAEADIACHLAAGRSLADIAEGLAISVETVRSHVKRVLTKTSTCRQAELVALIANRPVN